MKPVAPQMSEPEILVVDENEDGDRLDILLSRRLGQSRARIQRWIRDGRVRCAGASCRPSTPVRGNQRIEVRVPAPPPAELEPIDGPLTVLYEDDHVVAIDKPAGIVVHPGSNTPPVTLCHRLLAHYPELAQVGHVRRPGIVHRLDVGTTGVLLVARSQTAYEALSRAFQDRRVDKCYLALCYGAPRPEGGTIEQPIGRHRTERHKMTVRADGRAARTLYRVLARTEGVSALALRLETGRTHQIRVHLKHRHCPLVGDATYGEARHRGFPGGKRRLLCGFDRPALHAASISLVLPWSGEELSVAAPVAADLVDLWTRLGGVGEVLLRAARGGAERDQADRALSSE